MIARFLLSTATALAATLFALTTAASPTVSFQGLGALPGAAPHSEALGVSADGAVVVGYSSSGPGRFEAFRWTASGGMAGLGRLSTADRDNRATAASGDGAAIAGFGGFGDPEAFRWTQSDGMQGIGGNSRRAYGISADGAVLVGERRSGADAEAFHWSVEGGMQPLGYLPHLPEWSPISAAYGVSADGATVVGSSSSFSGQQAFRWTKQSGMVGLGDLPGGINHSGARAVTPDGSVIVGFGRSAAGGEAFRWTAAGGMQGLGDLPGGAFSSAASALSADGSIVVGQATSADGAEAFVWDAVHGMRSLKSVLIAAGLELSDWTLSDARSISADGRVVVGVGLNAEGSTEAWVATLEAVAALPGDFNNDRSVDAADYTTWRDGLGGAFTHADYETWRNNFGRTLEGASSSTVPEPTSFWALVLAALAYQFDASRRRR